MNPIKRLKLEGYRGGSETAPFPPKKLLKHFPKLTVRQLDPLKLMVSNMNLLFEGGLFVEGLRG